MSTTYARFYVQPLFMRVKMHLDQKRYRDALEDIKGLLSQDKKFERDLLIFLYRHLAENSKNLSLQLFLAEVCIYCKHYDDAMDCLEMVLDTDIFEKSAYALLGKLYKYIPNKTPIIACFEAALLKGIYEPDILNFLPTYYLETGDLLSAIRVYTQLVREFPKTVHYSKCLADLLEKKGAYFEAAEIYSSLVEKHPDFASEAAVFCEGLCKKQPENLDIHRILVGLYTQSCYPVGAVEHLHVLVAQDPDMIHYATGVCKQLLEIYPDTGDVLIELSSFLIKLERYTESVSCLRQLFDTGQDHPRISEHVALILEAYPRQVMALQLALELSFKKQDFEQVVFYIEQLVLLEETALDFASIETVLMGIMMQSVQYSLISRRYLAFIYFKQKAYAKAEAEVRRLIDTKEDCWARELLVTILLDSERDAEALRQIHKAQQLYPDHVVFYTLLKKAQYLRLTHKFSSFSQVDSRVAVKLGFFHFLKGDYAQALGSFSVIDSFHGEFFQGQLITAYIYFLQGQLDRNVTHLTQLLGHLESGSPEYLKCRFFLMWVFFEMGLTKEADIQSDAIKQFSGAYPFLQTFSVLRDRLLNGRRNHFLVAIPSWDSFFGMSETPAISFMPILAAPYYGADSCSASPKVSAMGLADPQINQSVNHILKGQWDIGARLLDQALSLDPNAVEILVNQSVVHILNHDLVAARKLLEVAQKAKFENWGVALNLGVLAYLEGAYEDAIYWLEHVLQLCEGLDIANLILGDVYYRLELPQKAMFFWKLAGASGRFFVHLQQRLWLFEETEPLPSSWIEHFNKLPNDYLKGF